MNFESFWKASLNSFKKLKALRKLFHNNLESFLKSFWNKLKLVKAFKDSLFQKIKINSQNFLGKALKSGKLQSFKIRNSFVKSS